MNARILSTIVSYVCFSACAQAYFSLAPFPNAVQIGQTYVLNWTATGNYSYTIWLIQENPGGNEYSWSKVSGLVTGLRFTSLNGNYSWTVPANISSQGTYGLWLDAFPIPFNGASFSNMTTWFAVSATSSASTSVSASTRLSTTGSTATSVVVSAAPTTTPSGASSGTKDSVHHNNLSGGAIAGIVIGCIIAIAVAITAFFFFVWRRKKVEFQKREAAARANRLAPVMKEGSPAYEMQDRAPQNVKEINI